MCNCTYKPNFITYTEHFFNVKWFAHIICASLIAMKINPVMLPSALIGSVLPDLLEIKLREAFSVFGEEKMVRHRDPIIHNFALPIVMLPLIFYPVFGGVVLGYAHHILLDMTTKYGVYFFTWRIRGIFRSYDWWANMAMIMLHILLVFLI